MLEQRASSSAVVMGDRAGLTHWANSGWRRLIGMPLDESLGKPIGSLLDRFAVDPGVTAYVSRRFLAGEVCEIEFPFSEPEAADGGSEQRWLRVRVNPVRNRSGEVSDFIAIAKEITDVVERGAAVEECELSELAYRCAAELVPELGSRSSFDAALARDLLPAYAPVAQLEALVRHLIRRAAGAIDDEWGTISLTTGLVGLGEEPIGTRDLTAGLPMRPYLFLEVHDTALTTLEEARDRLADPFLPARHASSGVSFPNAVQLVRELGGRIEFEHDGPFGTAIAVVLPA